MSTQHTIAVLLTTFNRKQKTLTCLSSLAQQELPAGVKLDIHMTDDASGDGTAAGVAERYPHVNLYTGNGSLFWAGGMRYTWQQAKQSHPDAYLLVNDDTIIYPKAVAILWQCVQHEKTPAICIGSTVDDETGLQSYGGSKLTSSNKWQSRMVEAGDSIASVDFGNANIMLVPAAIVNTIGILSDDYTHSLADYDYTLQAKKAGFKVLIAPGFLGSCKDDHGNNWKLQNVPLRQRIQYLKSPKGLAYHEYLLFIRRHFPYSYPAAFCKLWLKTLFPFLWTAFKPKAAISI